MGAILNGFQVATRRLFGRAAQCTKQSMSSGASEHCRLKGDGYIALIGNPNSGKTTLFNALTGSKQRVGNWPGVTVERKEGRFEWRGQKADLIDLPGLYSLSDSEESIDAQISRDFIHLNQFDLIVNVVDAVHLERHLYLTSQLLETSQPILVVLNMMDVAKRRGISIDVPTLEICLDCPVVAISSRRARDLRHLKNQLASCIVTSLPLSKPMIHYPAVLKGAIQAICQQMRCSELDAQQILEQDHQARIYCEQSDHLEDADILIADARYQGISNCVRDVVRRTDLKSALSSNGTAMLDRFVLNRFLGVPIFLTVMYLLFFFAINIGGAFQDFFEITSHALFVEGLEYFLKTQHAAPWFVTVLSTGIGRGISTTLTFVPVIGAMFLSLAFLEDCGYMARAAFVMDRLMQFLGLPGQSFIPMIVGFGCNVPAVMGARTLDNHKDRILTMMMMPFMSCSARLAIFSVFTAAFFPVGGQNIVFFLYLLGIGMAILTGFILRKSVLKGQSSSLVMELPPYHVPSLSTLLRSAWQRLKGFVLRSGRLIVPICLFIGLLSSFNADGRLHQHHQATPSILAKVGQTLTPLFSPMGIHEDNWPATVGLVTGILAKEVVIGTLNTLYAELARSEVAASESPFQFWQTLKEAVATISENLKGLKDNFSNPIRASAPADRLDKDIYGVMYRYFHHPTAAFAYLLFILLYFPCVSTIAVMRREMNGYWALFSMSWTTVLAYGVAVLFYQTTRLTIHFHTAALWIMTILAALGLTLRGLSFYSRQIK